jgi:hypothetical protein
VWVTEVWSTQAELDASLTLDSVKALVEQVVPLLAEPPERVDILPVGGKGLDAEQEHHSEPREQKNCAERLTA